MIQKATFRSLACLIPLTISMSALANADFEQGFAAAQEAFEKRSATDSAQIENAIQMLSDLETIAENSNQKYDVLILQSRAHFWKGCQIMKDKKKKKEAMEVFSGGEAKAIAASKVNAEYGEAYYFAGINLGRWAELNGVTESLFRRSDLEKYMNDAINHPSRTGGSGEKIEGYGPKRVLGRLYFKLPWVLGGSRDTSLEYLKEAYGNAKEVALNAVYYAETLYSGNSDDKAEAKRIVNELLASDENTYNPARIPETIEEFALARELKKKFR